MKKLTKAQTENMDLEESILRGGLAVAVADMNSANQTRKAIEEQIKTLQQALGIAEDNYGEAAYRVDRLEQDLADLLDDQLILEDAEDLIGA